MEEQWKQIENYDNYEVSTEGRVRNKKTGRILKPGENNRGYLYVILYKNGKQKNFSIHRLVATAFIPNPNGYDTVDHINHDKTDNRVENLRWLSHKNNSADGVMLTARKVYCVELDQTFDSITEASEVTGVWVQNICQCCKGKLKTTGGYHWKYVDES